MIELIERKRNVAEVNTLSPLTWAYVGDSVFELFVRTHLTNTTKLKPHMLHIEAIKYVKADAQVKLLHKIEKELNDDEKNICIISGWGKFQDVGMFGLPGQRAFDNTQ